MFLDKKLIGVFGYGEFLVSDGTDFYVSLEFGPKPLPEVFERRERKWGAMYASPLLGKIYYVME